VITGEFRVNSGLWNTSRVPTATSRMDSPRYQLSGAPGAADPPHPCPQPKTSNKNRHIRAKGNPSPGQPIQREPTAPKLIQPSSTVAASELPPPSPPRHGYPLAYTDVAPAGSGSDLQRPALPAP